MCLGGAHPLPLCEPRAGSDRRGMGLPWSRQVPEVWPSVVGEEAWGGGGGLSEGVGNGEAGGKATKGGVQQQGEAFIWARRQRWWG